MFSSFDSAHLDSLRQLSASFADIPEFRQGGKLVHPLGEILTIAFCSMVCGYERFTEMETFADDQRDWLQSFLDLPGGIPSHDTFLRVFSNVSATAFVETLAGWAGFDGDLSGKHVPIDGKTLAGTGVHLVRAWVDQFGLSVGQVACSEKSNEIEAIPRLLDALVLEGATVSIDAMGCQREIASKIEEADGHYLLALKGNQKEAHRTVRDRLGAGAAAPAPDLPETRTEEFTRGRYEARSCWVEHDLDFFGKSWKWDGLTCVARVRSETCRPGARGADGSEANIEDRYYLCSLPPEQATAERILELARAHWSVENRCHWMLDAVFGEDACPVREKTAARNLSTMRGMVLALLKKDPGKGSMKSKRQRCALNADFRAKIISNLHA